MSNKYKILELLKQKDSTIKEIAENTEFNENEVRVYINRLMNQKLVNKIGKKNRYIIYSAVKKENDKTLIDIERFLKLKKGYIQFNDLFENLTKNAKKLLKNNQLDYFKQIIQENIEIELIEQLNLELNK